MSETEGDIRDIGRKLTKAKGKLGFRDPEVRSLSEMTHFRFNVGDLKPTYQARAREILDLISRSRNIREITTLSDELKRLRSMH